LDNWPLEKDIGIWFLEVGPEADPWNVARAEGSATTWIFCVKRELHAKNPWFRECTVKIASSILGIILADFRFFLRG
jgi:hypothetical protein